MMIPDAPWIRDAEMYGIPEVDPAYCPYCHEEPEFFWISSDYDVLGCSRCIHYEDGYDKKCPVCGKKADELRVDNKSVVCGCEHCAHASDAYEWFIRHMT